jgi:hypothetical protein
VEDFSGISLSEWRFAIDRSVLCCSIPRQTNSLHSRSFHTNASKMLSCFNACCPARLPRNRSWKTSVKLHCGTLHTSQTKIPFYILTSNPQIIRGNLSDWKITRFGHASKGRGNTRINNEIRGSLSRKRITVSLQYVPAKKSAIQ